MKLIIMLLLALFSIILVYAILYATGSSGALLIALVVGFAIMLVSVMGKSLVRQWFER